MSGFYEVQNILSGPLTLGNTTWQPQEKRNVWLSDADEEALLPSRAILKRNSTAKGLPDVYGKNQIRDLDPGDSYATADLGRFKVLTANYTLKPEDSGTIFRCENSADIAITIPANLPEGVNVGVLRFGTAEVNLTAGSGATQRGTALTAISAQYKLATILAVKNNAGLTALDYLASEAG